MSDIAAEPIEVTLKQGEAKRLKIIYKEGRNPLDMTGATFNLQVEQDDEGTIIIDILDASFDKTEIADGIVYVPFSTTDTDQVPKIYRGELRADIAGGDVDKSRDILLTIERSIT